MDVDVDVNGWTQLAGEGLFGELSYAVPQNF